MIGPSTLGAQLVEPQELFETTNPALLKIVAFKKKFGPFPPELEEEFMSKLPEIVDNVLRKFEAKKKAGKK